jgi:Coenzyme PQQ synthesis protein D (PqqD)
MSGKPKPLESLLSVKPNPNVIFRRLGDEMVLFHLVTDRFYELNGTAARFWELLCEPEGGAGVHEKMTAEFAVDPEELVSETEALLTSLRKEDLVSIDE